MSFFLILRRTLPALALSLAFVLASCQEEPLDPLAPPVAGDRGFATAEVVERPLTDFTSSQSALYWYDSEDPYYRLYSDYTGYWNDVYGLNLGTTFDGSIQEKALDDGTAHVTVMLHGTKVLTWARYDQAPNTLVFGYNPGAVFGGATPVLGECFLRWEFINTAPGAPIPVLGTSGSLNFGARAVGELRDAAGLGPDGTLGMAWTQQVGLLDGVKPNTPHDDGYPAEQVKIKRLEPRMIGKN